MCGIAGVYNFDGAPAEPQEVRLITRSLAHRGPDGEGVCVDGEIGLGHRRLAVIDLTGSSQQPMACLDHRYWVTFNGEIFNFLELRAELQALGHHFGTDGDTEVIAHAFHRWGRQCVLHFNGMWAFAIWDTKERQLFLSRDHFGIKPLFYLRQARRLVFASELKAFFHLRGFCPQPNEEAVRQALGDQAAFELSTEALLQGVRSLPQGHNLSVGRSGVKLSRWWYTLDHVPAAPRKFSRQVDGFRELFFDACRLRLRSDVPIATCLSGGLDSSSVLSVLSKLADNDTDGAQRRSADFRRAFVATFPGTWKDEAAYAQMVVNHTGAEPRYCAMGAGDATDEVPQFVYDFENFGGSLLTPLWSIYRELRRDGVVVSLDGHGGDELLAGYTSHVNAALNGTDLVRAPRLVGLMKTLSQMGPSGDVTAQALLARRLGRSWLAQATGGLRHVARRPVEPTSGPYAWLRPGAGPPAESWVDDDERSAVACLEPLNAVLYTHFHHTVLPSILRNFERCSMAHGVEVRMPFLDWRLVSYVFGLPEESKIGGGYTKRLLREAMRGILPEAVRTRKDKIGFSPPMAHWFRGALGELVWAEVQTPPFLHNSLWDGKKIRDFVALRRASGKWTEQEAEGVWRFVHAHLWQQVFFGDRRSAGGGARVARPA